MDDHDEEKPKSENAKQQTTAPLPAVEDVWCVPGAFTPGAF